MRLGVSAHSLCRNPRFTRLLAATAVSELGTEISGLAIPLSAILALHAGVLEVGVLMALGFVPFAMFGLVAGAWVDRVRKRPLLISADILRAVALASVPLSWASGHLSIGQLYAVAFVVGSLNVLFEIAKQTYVPAVVDREQLGEANGRLMLAEQGSAVAGPGLGGLLIGAIGAPLAVTVDALSYIASAGLIAGIKHVEVSAGPAKVGMGRSMVSGVQFVVGNRLLLPIAIIGSLVTFFARMVQVVLLVYLAREARLTPAAIGVVFAIAGGGFVLGALVADSAGRRLGIGLATTTGLMVVSAGLVLIALGPPATAGWWATAGLFVYGVAAVIWTVNVTTLRQLATPREMLGRVTATMRVVSYSVIPLAAVTGGALGSAIGLRQTLAVAAAGAVLAALAVLASPLPRGHAEQPITSPEFSKRGQSRS
jgi:MFS family permease